MIERRQDERPHLRALMRLRSAVALLTGASILLLAAPAPPSTAATRTGARRPPPVRSVPATVDGGRWWVSAFPDRVGKGQPALTWSAAGSRPVIGDWNGDGIATPGVFRDGRWQLRNSWSANAPVIVVRYGRRGDVPVVADWDGDGVDTLAVVRNGTWRLRRRLGRSGDWRTFTYGRHRGDIPVAGDWNRDGRASPGFVRGYEWHLRDGLQTGPASVRVRHGRRGDIPVAGDWNADGRTTIGVVRGRTWLLRDRNASGGTTQARNGPPGTPVVYRASRTPRGTCPTAVWNPRMAGGDPARYVLPPRHLDRTPPTDAAALRTREVVTNATRYLLGHDYAARYAQRDHRTYNDLLTDYRFTEHAVRGPAMGALAAAIALRTGGYAPDDVGRSRGFAEQYVARIVRSLACQHASVTPGGWGAAWQSALWAEITGKAGWLLWDRLAPTDRAAVARMVAYEADRFVDHEVPYWRDLSGVERYRGDTKAEENNWNAAVLHLAGAMMPTHPHRAAWQEKAIELQLAAWSTPEDAVSGEVVHGRPLAEWLDGSNITSEGLVVNHGRVHPDYAAAIATGWVNASTYTLAGQPAPEALFHNGALVYGALSTYAFDPATYQPPGGTVYIEDSGELYFPQGNDWGTRRRVQYMEFDVMAGAYGQDGATPRGAAYWEELHTEAQLALQRRFGDGRTHGDWSEHRSEIREQYTAQRAAYTWLTKYLALHAPLQVDASGTSASVEPAVEPLAPTAVTPAREPYATAP